MNSVISVFDFKYKKMIKSYKKSDASFNHLVNHHIYYHTVLKNPSLENIFESMISSKFVAKQLLSCGNQEIYRQIPLVILRLTQGNNHLSTLKMILNTPHLVAFNNDCTECIMPVDTLLYICQMTFMNTWRFISWRVKNDQYIGYHMLLKYIFSHRNSISNTNGSEQQMKRLMNMMTSVFVEHGLRPYLTVICSDDASLNLLNEHKLKSLLTLTIKSRWKKELELTLDHVQKLLENPEISSQLRFSLQDMIQSSFHLAINHYYREGFKLLLSKSTLIRLLTSNDVGTEFLNLSNDGWIELVLDSEIIMDKLELKDFYKALKNSIIKSKLNILSSFLNHPKFRSLSDDRISYLYALSFQINTDVIMAIEAHPQVMSHVSSNGYHEALINSITNDKSDEPFLFIWQKNVHPSSSIFRALRVILSYEQESKLRIVFEHSAPLNQLLPFQYSKLLDSSYSSLVHNSELANILLDSDIFVPFITSELVNGIYLSSILNGNDETVKTIFKKHYYLHLNSNELLSGLKLAIDHSRISLIETMLNYPHVIRSFGQDKILKITKRIRKRLKGMSRLILCKRFQDFLISK